MRYVEQTASAADRDGLFQWTDVVESEGVAAGSVIAELAFGLTANGALHDGGSIRAKAGIVVPLPPKCAKSDG